MENIIMTKLMIDIMGAYYRGKKIEVSIKGCDEWFLSETPSWDWKHCDYRIAIERKDEIDWSQVNPTYKSMARNEDGRVYFHSIKYPTKTSKAWRSAHSCRVSQSSYKQGTISWEKSLIIRPDNV